MRLKEMLVGLEGLKAKGNLDIDIKGIAFNSKEIKEGYVFVAIKGFETDGHNYINEAIESLEQIDDDILRELKINEISKEFDIDDSVIRNKIKVKEVKNKKEEVTNKDEIKRYNKYDISEIRILYLMLNYDDVILYFENSLGYLINDSRSNLAYKIIEFRNDNGYFNLFDFEDSILENNDLNNTLKEVMSYHNNKEYTNEELEDYINTIKEYSVKREIDKLKKEMKDTLDINKKIEIAKKIQNINKEVLKW